MKFEYSAHSYALQIESIFRRVLDLTDRGGFGGLADADFCERNPFIAISVILSKSYTASNKGIIDELISSYYWDVGKSISEVGESRIKEIIEKVKEVLNK